ncbi:MAG: helix-turn-helix domain-containing protein [Thermoanaerobaculia bacterium]|jgi:AraC family ethanolamine operon transcriptional activator
MADFIEQQPPAFHLKAKFHDFDEIAETVEGWDLDWQQLDRGRLEATVQQLGSLSWLLTRVSFSRQFHQRGGTPPGFLTFGMPGKAVEELNWCGQSASGTNLMVFRSGGEYESTSQADFQAHTFSFSEELLDRVAGSLDLPTVKQLLTGSHEVFAPDSVLLGKMRARLQRIFRTAAADPTCLSGPGLRQEIESELPKLLLQALAQGRVTRRPRSSAVRSRAMSQAKLLIAEALDEHLTVQEICDSVGVSERTLRYAFQEQLGVSPKRYLQSVRLNRVRREIRTSPPDVKIADVANRWGFWHMGQFAADYRRHFDELPSETLRRTR